MANALRLNDAERRHLFDLCQLPVPGRVRRQIEVSESLKRMVDCIPSIAYVLSTRRWDVLYGNIPATALFDIRVEDEANAMELIFLDKYHRSLMRDWEPWARAVVAKFRLDVAAHLSEPDVMELIEKLRDGSAEFRRWWSEPEVLGRDEIKRAYVHPVRGEVVVTPTALIVEHAPELRLRIFTPVDESSADKLRDLVADLQRSEARIRRL